MRWPAVTWRMTASPLILPRPPFRPQVGPLQFPEGSVPGWNTHDHGVNNAEGAMRWPAVTWRMTGNPDDAAQQEVLLRMLDTYQGQVAALFCADEVFCGRAPHRGAPKLEGHTLVGIRARVRCAKARETYLVVGGYQGQVATLFCADEVFCGRAPHRGEPMTPCSMGGGQDAA
jgi:hypothetical protein